MVPPLATTICYFAEAGDPINVQVSLFVLGSCTNVVESSPSYFPDRDSSTIIQMLLTRVRVI